MVSEHSTQTLAQYLGPRSKKLGLSACREQSKVCNVLNEVSNVMQG